MVARLIIAGTSSNVGKTTVTVAVTRALHARGLRVASFKCGPDYLDPTYHARAAGVPCHNLDGWMMGREAVLSTFHRVANAADVALIEGVMGLFDGASPRTDVGSTAEIAKWLDAPVLLVCETSGMARSIAALGHGFATFDPEVRVVGLVCNRIGGRRHLELLRKAIASPPVFGGFPEDASLAFPERHLGLHTASREELPEALFVSWGERAAEWLDIDALLAAAQSAPSLPGDEPSRSPAKPAARRCRIGIAFDEAFHFYYDDNLSRLEALGATIVRFSPLRDRRLPDVDGLYLGGGYPEVYAEALAENRSMRKDVASFAAARGSIYAECGGLMYLCSNIKTLRGQMYPMVGLIPANVEMKDHLQALGYVEVETQAVTPLGAAGLRFRGHQFRYSDLSLHGNVECAYSVRRRRSDDVIREGYRVGNTLASYVHAHWASNPLVANGFVEACASRGKP